MDTIGLEEAKEVAEVLAPISDGACAVHMGRSLGGLVPSQRREEGAHLAFVLAITPSPHRAPVA